MLGNRRGMLLNYHSACTSTRPSAAASCFASLLGFCSSQLFSLFCCTRAALLKSALRCGRGAVLNFDEPASRHPAQNKTRRENKNRRRRADMGGGGQTAEDSDICPQEDCVGKRELADPSCFVSVRNALVGRIQA